MTDELKKLAAERYNRAFELVIEGDESTLLEGLELAASSLNLWRLIGPDRRLAIGLWLYSRALQKAGSQTLAIEAAEESLRLAKLDGQDWMIASALEALTRASIGTSRFEAIRAQAEQAISQITDNEERELISGQFDDLRLL